MVRKKFTGYRDAWYVGEVVSVETKSVEVAWWNDGSYSKLTQVMITLFTIHCNDYKNAFAQRKSQKVAGQCMMPVLTIIVVNVEGHADRRRFMEGYESCGAPLVVH